MAGAQLAVPGTSCSLCWTSEKFPNKTLERKSSHFSVNEPTEPGRAARPSRKGFPKPQEASGQRSRRCGTEAMTGPATQGQERCPRRLCPRGATCRLVTMVQPGGQGPGCLASHCHCPFCRVLSLEASPATDPALKRASSPPQWLPE